MGNVELTRARFFIVRSGRIERLWTQISAWDIPNPCKKKKLLNLRVIKHWTRLLREVVEFLVLEVSRTEWPKAVSGMHLQPCFPEQGLTRWPLELPFNVCDFLKQ